MEKQTVIIIGAGPAGLTAAWELINHTDIKPVIFELSDQVGGISKTMNYQGNLIDMGPHRFFSKSQRVIDFWQSIFPFVELPTENKNEVLRIRRQTRILFLKKFFDYPISLSLKTLSNLGVIRVIKIGLSYIKIRLLPIKPEKNLADFYINRFGRELYETFFKDYTAKVWGVPCEKIPQEWGAQRVKGLSIREVLVHAIKNIFKVSGRKTETSLIESFWYPKFGAGQIYEELAKKIITQGGEIILEHQIISLVLEENKITSVLVKDLKTGEEKNIIGDYYISTMPISELFAGLKGEVPSVVNDTALNLVYRDYILVGLLLKKISFKNQPGLIGDNWIYIQERDMKMGRLDFVNNFSLSMLKDKNLVWLGAEYFCTQGDELWQMSDVELGQLAVNELKKIKAINTEDVLETVVFRQKKAYPAYFGSYENFSLVKDYISEIENLFLVGRNGMHRYNNMDHSILTAMTAVDNIAAGIKTKENIWQINTEEEYHESKK